MVKAKPNGQKHTKKHTDTQKQKIKVKREN